MPDPTPQLQEQITAILAASSLGDGVSPAHARLEHLADGDGQLRLLVSVPPPEVARLGSRLEDWRLTLLAVLTKQYPNHHIQLALTMHQDTHQEAVAPTIKSTPAPAKTTPPPNRSSLLPPQIARVIAVASGKGGVGKSTTALNLAIAFGQLGWRVGLLDADIYGPSLPRLIGQADTKLATHKDEGQPTRQRLSVVPFAGVACMSMGFLVPEQEPIIWRGPMVMGAVQQLFSDVDWPALDLLVVDMPPGTGDAHLTLVQRVPLNGAIIVSTPQDLALIDARKGLAMFQRTQVPVLGMVENMSLFHCSHCGQDTPIFGHGGAQATAEALGIPFLGALPLDPAIMLASEVGQPITLAQPDHPASQTYRQIAERCRQQLQS
ncbi:MAG: Mrp/NBP35 family ATP-binding protein [Alphaproteobacteria bacterium]|nr:Mrp/NBP35 family ATP-binding protein [Alphaproteobacteria bacterium]